MARDYAKIFLRIADDPGWRALTRHGQHLYLTLLISPTINQAGVGDWRPVRLAAHATGWTPAEVEEAGAELVGNSFVVIDHATEEVLVRSFIRHDGILSGPKTAQGMANAYRRVVSLDIRSAICREVAKLRSEMPESGAWKVPDALAIALNPVPDEPIPGYPATMPGVSDGVSDGVSQQYPASMPGAIPSINHQPSTKQPSTFGAAARGSRIPEDWKPTEADMAWFLENGNGIDGRMETQKFVNHFLAKAGKDALKVDWSRTWRNWILNSQKYAATRPTPGGRPTSTTDTKVAATLALADLYAEAEADQARRELTA